MPSDTVYEILMIVKLVDDLYELIVVFVFDFVKLKPGLSDGVATIVVASAVASSVWNGVSKRVLICVSKRVLICVWNRVSKSVPMGVSPNVLNGVPQRVSNSVPAFDGAIVGLNVLKRVLICVLKSVLIGVFQRVAIRVFLIVRCDIVVKWVDGEYLVHERVVAYGNSVIGVAAYMYSDGLGTYDVDEDLSLFRLGFLNSTDVPLRSLIVILSFSSRH